MNGKGKVMIAIASDHGGYDLKERVKKYLEERGLEYKDFGCENKNSCDYPDFIRPAAKAVAGDDNAIATHANSATATSAIKVYFLFITFCFTFFHSFTAPAERPLIKYR